MSCYYFKLSFISILLCILIITHKFCLEQITHNKSNNFNIINGTHRRLLAEPHKTHLLKNHSGENSLTQPIVNKLGENNTKCRKKSPSCTSNDDIYQEHDSKMKKIICKNEKNIKSWFQKFHKKSPCNKLKTIMKIILIILFWEFAILYYFFRYIYKKIKKHFHTD
ncbi:Plasmodium exported protein (hyp10), unknown function [Plasmodium reichenowi]|uniref:Uncharacterized protein n=1 Tax=Plasmodium reichenowi TaxID=5854 RepID=A0A2P9DSI4_PLARE|nr:Plasmodium exported protein (hyp10), unknown function [Plasmodium reichenowi]